MPESCCAAGVRKRSGPSDPCMQGCPGHPGHNLQVCKFKLIESANKKTKKSIPYFGYCEADASVRQHKSKQRGENVEYLQTLL
jgi:hypothetical protein